MCLQLMFPGVSFLNSLHVEFEQLKISWNSQKDKQDIDELITICVEEEGMKNQNKP